MAVSPRSPSPRVEGGRWYAPRGPRYAASPMAEEETRAPVRGRDAYTSIAANMVRVGQQRAYLGDLYATLLSARWRALFVLYVVSFVLVNGAFALAYWLHGDCIEGARTGSFDEAFFFSVQTICTIGFGVLSPKGTFGNVLVTLEAMTGLVGLALGTGLVFAKFSRPSARVLFSRVMVVHTRNGKPCLVFRIANGRGNSVIEASVRVTVLIEEETREGERLRTLKDLALMRATSPVFTMSWVVMHVIDEASSLFGVGARALAMEDARFIVSFTGIDATFSQTVHASYVYFADDVRFDHRFVDVVSRLPDGRTKLDLRRFHDTEPVAAPPFAVQPRRKSEAKV